MGAHLHNGERGVAYAYNLFMNNGVIIVNTGSPTAPTPGAVANYLYRFLSDPRICPMNPRLWKFILKHFIVPKRSSISATKYASIWTDAGSPIDVYMNSLAKKLERACQQDGIACVDYATSYSSPSIEDAFDTCKNRGCDSLIVIPLYPQSAFSTTGAVRDKVEATLAAMRWEVDMRFVENYCDNDTYIKAVANSIACTDFDSSKGDKLLFTFHSIPIADIKHGDTYGSQTQRTAKRVASALRLDDDAWHIGYQCRFDKGRSWLAPFSASVLKDLTDAKRLFVVAPNFSVDCLETIYDIQQELCARWVDIKKQESDRPEEKFRYISCLNDSDKHVEVVRNVLLDIRGLC